MMNIKGIFAVSLIAMVAVVAGAHTSNAVAAIASKGYVDQQVGSKLSSISGSTTGSGNVVTGVSASGSTVSVTKSITAEETKNKVTSTNYDANVSSDTKYPTVKAVADAIADVKETISAAITVDSALSSTSTNPVQNKVINTALSGKEVTSNKVKSVRAVASATDTAYPSEKAVATALATKANTSALSGYATIKALDAVENTAVAAQSDARAAQEAANAKVATAQGLGNENKAVITDSSGNVTTGQIASGMIANDAVTSAKLAAGAVDANALAAGAVTSAKIADGTIPTVNDATLTIQKNGSTVDTFTANASANKTINITVPTKTSELDNDSGFVTSANLPVATANTLGGVKSGGSITVDTSGTVTVNSAQTATNAKIAVRAENDAEGKDIILTYATKSQITALDSSSSGTGAVVTGVSQTDGKVSVTKGNVQIPFGGQNATDYAAIWVE